MDLTARTLTLDLLSTFRNGAMPVRALVEAGALFGFAENNVRVSLSKLYAEGRVTRDERGRYRLSEGTRALSQQLQRWRQLEEQHRPWKGDWVAIHCPRLGRGSQRRRRERALEVLGFRKLEAGLYVRPDNLRGGVDSVRTRFFAIADPAREGEAPVLVYGLRNLDPSTELRARSLWDSAALRERYRSALRDLEDSRERLVSLSHEEAMVESFLVGAGVVRALILDPLLPAPILDPTPRRALVDDMNQYDELGRTTWAPFLERHGVPHRGMPSSWRATYGAPDDDAVVKGADT